MNVSVSRKEVVTAYVTHADWTHQTCYAQPIAVGRSHEDAYKEVGKKRKVGFQAQARAKILEHQLRRLRQSVVDSLFQLFKLRLSKVQDV